MEHNQNGQGDQIQEAGEGAAGPDEGAAPGPPKEKTQKEKKAEFLAQQKLEKERE